MLPLTARAIAELAGGRLAGGNPDVRVTGVTIDTRRLGRGELFVALRGEHADGHSFLDDAVRAGAAAVLVRGDAPVPDGVAVVRVDEPALGLSRLAAGVRERLSARVVAITGSSGKTITKDLTAAVAQARFRTVTSEESFNNEIGVPLTVLRASEETEVLVAEVGSRGVGHIAALMPMLKPHVGVVVNVGVAHIGMFGSADAIATAKGEIVENLPPDGVAVLNADDPAVDAMAERTRARVLRFGTSAAADVRADRVTLDDLALPGFTLVTSSGEADVRLRIAGEHLVSDALAAATVGVALGIRVEEIAAALSEAPGPRWRMQVTDTRGGVRIVNDAYNANPASAAAALKALVAMARGRRTWAVLGAMAELGEHSIAEHDRIGRLVVRLGVRRLVAVGNETRPLYEAARREGMTTEEATLVDGADGALELLRSELEPADVVLVKASRAAGLERVAITLEEDPA